MGVDWSKASREERKALYAVTKKIIDYFGMSWDRLFAEALGMTLRPEYPNDNFSKGTISRSYARRIHEWLAANHLDMAVHENPLLFDPALKSDWEQLIREHGVFGRADVILDDIVGLIEVDDGAPLSETIIRLGQRFSFQIESELAGRMLALQQYQGQWYLLPLTDAGVKSVACQAQSIRVPLSEKTGAPKSMREISHPGERAIVFLVVPPELTNGIQESIPSGAAVHPKTLRALAHALNRAVKTDWAVYRLNVFFSKDHGV